MATCQQAGGGNIILGRKAAAISLCMLALESSQLDERLDPHTIDRGSRSTSLTLVPFVSLSLSSPSVCFCPAL